MICTPWMVLYALTSYGNPHQSWLVGLKSCIVLPTFFSAPLMTARQVKATVAPPVGAETTTLFCAERILHPSIVGVTENW